MKTIRWYSPGGDGDQGGSSADDRESILRQEGTHEPGDTPLEDQEELPGGFIHGHVDQGNDEE
ncbi:MULTISPECIES: hypothetical protein [Spirosoma]|uniref:Uncharacterized protein n=1 Tax=Spirosoma liriopis TaxID=2937440 RepID=A0ABT0HR34_9BACT|nr:MULTISPECIES: hypothetical protein [Spirosoma]MCK8494642.1 hypothetical protein [Spirosoma liriopis]UHG93899.1 hypothetical protein LQ777_24350 [Spirosoma oryzicola]